MPSRASSSARSLSSWPAWPLTQCHDTLCWAERRVEALPQLGVLHRLFVGGLPAVLLPAVNPFADAVLHVDGVDVHLDRAGPLQAFQCHDGRHQLHAVVGGQRLAARQFLARAVVIEDDAPAARTRISRTGAIGMDDNLVRRHAAGMASRNSRGSLNDTFSSRSVTFSTVDLIARAEGVDDFIDQNLRRRGAGRQSDCAQWPQARPVEIAGPLHQQARAGSRS